jgi:hypothetical protein
MHETVHDNTEFDQSIISQFNSPTRPQNASLMSMNPKVDKLEQRQRFLLDLAKRFGITDAEIEADSHPGPKKPRKSLANRISKLVSDNTENKEVEEREKLAKIEKCRQGRKMVAQELMDTERNYVKLLGYVIDEYKAKLDTSGLISDQECRQIFGNLPDLHNLHSALETDMAKSMISYNDDTHMGKIISSYCDRFLHHYPPYINYLDQSLTLIKEIQESNNKFKAFLRSILSRATYSRQDLSDLLSLPVQRLPRYALLLTELKKKTEGININHPDIEHLEIAIQQIKKVLSKVKSTDFVILQWAKSLKN